MLINIVHEKYLLRIGAITTKVPDQQSTAILQFLTNNSLLQNYDLAPTYSARS
jgi:hypothetical protein